LPILVLAVAGDALNAGADDYVTRRTRPGGDRRRGTSTAPPLARCALELDRQHRL